MPIQSLNADVIRSGDSSPRRCCSAAQSWPLDLLRRRRRRQRQLYGLFELSAQGFGSATLCSMDHQGEQRRIALHLHDAGRCGSLMRTDVLAQPPRPRSSQDTRQHLDRSRVRMGSPRDMISGDRDRGPTGRRTTTSRPPSCGGSTVGRTGSWRDGREWRQMSR